MTRDRRVTEAKLLSAAERVIARSGFGDIGIAAIAAEADVDKVLIYRYFGGLQQLLARLAAERPLWPASGDASPAASLDRAVATAVTLVGRELRERDLVRQGAAWEGVLQNPVTDQFVSERERESDRLLDVLRSRFPAPPYLDLQSFIALLTAAVIYLATHRDSHFLGLDLSEPAVWQKLERTVGMVARAVLGVE